MPSDPSDLPAREADKAAPDQNDQHPARSTTGIRKTGRWSGRYETEVRSNLYQLQR